MPKIILKTDNGRIVFSRAVHGQIGLVPFKCWDVKGSEAFRARILKRNASAASYYVLGPVVKGLISRLERGGKHSARNKARMTEGGRKGGEKKGWRKYYSQVNVPQSLQGAQSRRASNRNRGGSEM